MAQDILLLIDAQTTYMDKPLAHTEELPIRGSSVSAVRTAALLDQARSDIAAVIATFDSHGNYGIERPGFWVDASGAPVPAWTQIGLEDVAAGVFRTADPKLAEHALRYLSALAGNGQAQKLMIWPVHGVLGTPGHALAQPIADALARWEISQHRGAIRVLKGTNPLTEHFGAFEADVPLEQAPETQFNRGLAAAIRTSLQPAGSRLLVAGQASTHCVPATLYQLARDTPDIRSRLTILRDCMNPVPGFEANEAALFDWVTAGGGEVITATDYLTRGQ